MPHQSDPDEDAATLDSSDGDNGYSLAAEKLGEIFRWVIDGTGIQIEGKLHGSGGVPRAQVVGKRMIALIAVCRPDLLRETKLRPLAVLSGLDSGHLCRELQRVERAFGVIVAKRDRATKPHFSGSQMQAARYAEIAEGRGKADKLRHSPKVFLHN